MAEETRRTNRTGLAAGWVIISAAIAILISYYANEWWYFFPIMMISIGIYVLGIGLLTTKPTAGSSFIYMLLWGGILLILGVEWIINALYPNNVVLLVIVFLVFIGVVAILGYVVRSRK